MRRGIVFWVLVLGLSTGADVGRCAEPTVLDLGGGVTMQFVTVPAGSFEMGSPPTEPGRGSDEGPVRTVTFSRSFLMGATEVTQRQWQEVMGSSPSHFNGPSLPMDTVSWNDAKEFCRRLGALTGKSVRLPTESEWEYACRAGSLGPRYGELDPTAWYSGNSETQTHDVGSKAPNAWGLFDMLGNVREWCEDAHRASYAGAPMDGSAVAGSGHRVLRGGAWGTGGRGCRAADRLSSPPAFVGYFDGVRVVVEPSAASR